MKMTIRTQITGLVLGIAIIPCIAVSVFLLVYVWNTEIHSAELLAYERAQTVSTEIGVLLLRHVTAIDQLGRIYGNVSFDIALRTRLLDDFLASHSEITDVVVVNNRGKETDHRNSVKDSFKDLSDRSQNIEFTAIKEKGYYVGPVYISQQKSLFLIGRQIVQSNSQVHKGAIFILVDAGVLQEKIKKMSAEIRGSNIYIINDKGAVIAHLNSSYLIEGKDFSHVPSLRLAVAHSAVYGSSYYNEKSENVIGVGAPVTITFSEDREFPTNWFAVTEVPVSVALASAIRMRTIALEIIGLIFLVVIGAGIIIAKRFALPIELLDNTFKKVNDKNSDNNVLERNNIVRNIPPGFNTFSNRLTQSMVDFTHEQEAVTAEKKKLVLAFSRMSDGVIAVNEQGEIVLANEKAEQFTSVSVKNMLGRRMEDLIRFYDKDKELSVSHVSIVAESYASHTDGGACILRVVSHNCEHIAKITSGALFDICAERGYLFTLHDMTHEYFLKKVKSDFIAITAHQLRTPLAEIKWSIDTLLGTQLGATTHKQKELLKRSFESNEHMIHIVDDLLKTANLEEAQYHYEKKPSDIKKIVHEICMMYRGQAKSRGISLVEKKIRTKIPLVSVDANAMKVVLKNLIENAIYYTPTKGKVVVVMEQNGDKLRISVIDSGIGITIKERDQLFTKFFRGKEAFKMETTGNGLGLYIVKKIIEAHDGNVWVDSSPNKGSTFGFEIPI